MLCSVSHQGPYATFGEAVSKGVGRVTLATGVRWGHVDSVEAFMCANYFMNDPVLGNFCFVSYWNVL